MSTSKFASAQILAALHLGYAAKTNEQIIKHNKERKANITCRSNIQHCIHAMQKDLDQQEYLIHKQIFGYLKYACSCSFTDANIENGFFLCGAEDHQILYRAHIIGTRDYSANDLVELLQDWVASAKAYVTVSNFRMLLDSTCSARLDTMDSAECPMNAIVTTTPTTSAPEKQKSKRKILMRGKTMELVTARAKEEAMETYRLQTNPMGYP